MSDELDHLRALLMAERPQLSSGAYHPTGVTLRLAARDTITDHVVYLHEVHHGALNDSTAWGSALHATARIPGADAMFLELLDGCRRIHEAYATFASVNLVERESITASAVLDAYPNYRRLSRQFQALVADVTGGVRTYLAATAIARLCMQTTILRNLDEERLARLLLPDLTELETPDGRFAALLDMPEAVERAAHLADRDATAGGVPAASLDDESASIDTGRDVALDQRRTRWEQVFYRALGKALEEADAPVVDYDGHQVDTGDFLARVHRLFPGLSLRSQLPDEPQHDPQLAAAILEPMRIDLTDHARAAVLIHLDPQEIASASELPGRPRQVMFIDARLPLRLLDHYDWNIEDTARLREAPQQPVVASRLAGQSMSGDEIIAHAALAVPTVIPELRRSWPADGQVVVCVAASCLIDVEWRDAWLPTAAASADVVFLVDVELPRLVRSWAKTGGSVAASLLEVADRHGETRHGLLVNVAGTLWLAISNDVGVRLMLHILLGTTELTVTITSELTEDVRDTIESLVEHLLATERYLALDGVSGYL